MQKCTEPNSWTASQELRTHHFQGFCRAFGLPEGYHSGRYDLSERDVFPYQAQRRVEKKPRKTLQKHLQKQDLHLTDGSDKRSPSKPEEVHETASRI